MSAAQRKDRDTVAMPNPHVIARGTRHPFGREDESVSPVAVLAVIGLLIALFIAVLQLN